MLEVEPGPDGKPRVHPEDRAEWRAWLVEHHRRDAGVWLVTFKKAARRPTVTYDDAVEEALCVGWVDSKPGKLDELRTMLWFAPRKPGSGWSRPNKERIARLQSARLMLPAGQAVVDAAIADGSWTMLDAVEDLVVPDDLAAAFAERPGSRDTWESFPRSVKRGDLERIVQAKTPPTRAKRIAEIADQAAKGERTSVWTPRATP
ncbi:MAG: YdeI/OmpD-associated family protein [Ilumatobacteraceae bacterium]|nr:YdeI/OmpD-associated family protein [Ilumatobacteraceae bacterium]